MSGPQLEGRGAVGWITVDDEPGERAGQLLGSAVRAAENDPEIRCLVIRGSTLAFDASAALVRLRTTSVPTIAGWTGEVRAAGAALLLACDFRVAAEDATIRFDPAGAPSPFPAGLPWQLKRAVGRCRAFELLATSRTLTAAELHALGLISQCATRDELDGVVETLAAELARQSPRTLSALKRSLNFGDQADFDESVEFDRLLDYS